MNKQRILIIGAGAVGTSYAYFLAKKHDVSFLVKDKYVNDIKNGYLFDWMNKKDQKTELFSDYETLSYSTLDATREWDVIIITLATTALPKLDMSNINTTGATVISLSPGLEDLQMLESRLEGKSYGSIVTGMISLISFTNDIDGKFACHFYASPAMPMPFSDVENTANPQAKQIAKLFNDSGLKSKSVKSSLKAAVYPNVFLTMFVLALEAAGWSFATLKNSGYLLDSMRHSIQALNKASKKEYGLMPPVHGYLLPNFVLRIGLNLAPKLFPFDIETYLKQHFTKVQAQSYEHTRSYIEICKKHGVDAQVVEDLLAKAEGTA